MPWHLVPATLRAHKLRTLLTAGSIAVAVFLLVFLRTVLVSLRAGIDGSSSKRLMVQSAVSLFVGLPPSYQGKIDGVPGVKMSCKQDWFGGYYREPSNFFAQFAVDHERFLETYPEVKLVEGDTAAFTAKRNACLIGTTLAEKYGFKVGDTVPIIGTIFPRTDGRPWDFEVVGIYESTSSNVDSNTLWFRYDFLEEAHRAGATTTPIFVGVYVLSLDPGADPIAVAAKVDALFENGPQRVHTTSEAEFQRQFVTMLGSVPFFLNSIGLAILFAILLAAINTMLLSARQRTHDFGVLKALGFADGVTFQLLMIESLFVSGLGGALGLGAVVATAPKMRAAMLGAFPTWEVTNQTLALAVGLAVGVGVVAGLLPAWQTSRLKVVDALRSEG